MRLLVEMWVDGYETEKEMETACIELLEDLDSTGISVKVLWAGDAIPKTFPAE